MIERLTHVNPPHCRKVLAALSFGSSLLFLPFFLVTVLTKWTGGIEFTLDDMPLAFSAQGSLPTNSR